MPFHSSRRHLSSDDCLEDNVEDYHNGSVLCCLQQLCTVICTLGLDLHSPEGFRL